MTYELALTGADIKAAVGFHSGLQVTSPGDAKQIKAKVLALLGADDPSIPAESREAFGKMLSEGGVDWQITVYGGVVHSFTNEKADRFGAPRLRPLRRQSRRTLLETDERPVQGGPRVGRTSHRQTPSSRSHGPALARKNGEISRKHGNALIPILLEALWRALCCWMRRQREPRRYAVAA